MQAYACPRCGNVAHGDPATLRCPRCGYPDPSPPPSASAAPGPAWSSAPAAGAGASGVPPAWAGNPAPRPVPRRPLAPLRTWLMVLVPLALLASTAVGWALQPDLASLRDLASQASQTNPPSQEHVRQLLRIFVHILGYVALASVVSIPAFVLKILWTYRARSNVEGRQQPFTWGRGWAIGAWFIPLASAILPYLLLREVDRATLAPPGSGPQWKQAPASSLLLVTMVLEVLVVAGGALAGVVSGAMGNRIILAAEPAWILVTLVLQGIAVACFLLFVDRLTKQQDSWPTAP